MNHFSWHSGPMTFPGLWVNTEIGLYSVLLAVRLWFRNNLTLDVNALSAEVCRHPHLRVAFESPLLPFDPGVE